jgi:hypothetical protein
MFVEHISGEMLGQILGARNLVERESTAPEFLLDPHLVQGQVSNFADPTPPTNPGRRCRVHL